MLGETLRLEKMGLISTERLAFAYGDSHQLWIPTSAFLMKCRMGENEDELDRKTRLRAQDSQRLDSHLKANEILSVSERQVFDP